MATRTTCPYCGVGCGIVARPRSDGVVEIAGDQNHPANFGRLCSKGSALGETLSLDGRLLHPQIGPRRVAWQEALDVIARRFSATIAEHGPDSVAFYVSGQLLTEDYYVANKLMKGFIGSSNIDTNSRLCMASSVAGHKRAFGSDTVPGNYEDLELADLVVLVGSNLAWCHPVLFQRLAAARESRGTKVVVVDPRRTATCEIADLHLPIRSGTDVALFNGLLSHLVTSQRADRSYVLRHTSGFEEALIAASRNGASDIARLCGLSAADVARFYDMFASTDRALTIYSQGVNQSSAGTDKVNAIINCHLATGRIGKPGMGPLSVTGQPNAMGGRETGGLANMLAAHMDLGDSQHRRIVQEFWRSPTIATQPGLKAVDLFRAVGDGRIKALWIMATNPVDSMPEADTVRAALQRCPFVVVSDVARHTDTTAYAHVLLPSAAWGEKDGTVTNSERRISRQRSFLPLPGSVRPDWWQLAEVARRMGFAQAFAYAGPAEIFAEYARLTAAGNDGTRDLDIGEFATISAAGYDALEPFQWPRPAGATNATRDGRFFAEGLFYTADRRARFVPTPFRAPQQQTSSRYPMVLNTGRLRDQWHTMTRTAKSARLMAHHPEPALSIHPRDADEIGLASGMIAEVESSHGRALLRVALDADIGRGEVFAPMHWTSQLTSSSRIGAVVAGACDPISGQPELKHTPVLVRPYPAAWYAFAMTQQQPHIELAPYVAMAAVARGWRVELAGLAAPPSWEDLARCLFAGTADILAYRDATAGRYRFAAYLADRLVGALFVAPTPVDLARSWAVDRLGEAVPANERLLLLAGRPGSGTKDKGRLVCACFEVGCNDIAAAAMQGCASVAAIGQALSAGTNCGSCRSEIARIIDEACLQKAG